MTSPFLEIFPSWKRSTSLFVFFFNYYCYLCLFSKLTKEEVNFFLDSFLYRWITTETIQSPSDASSGGVVTLFMSTRKQTYHSGCSYSHAALAAVFKWHKLYGTFGMVQGRKEINKNVRYVQQYLNGWKQSCSTCRSVLMTEMIVQHVCHTVVVALRITIVPHTLNPFPAEWLPSYWRVESSGVRQSKIYKCPERSFGS